MYFYSVRLYRATGCSVGSSMSFLEDFRIPSSNAAETRKDQLAALDDQREHSFFVEFEYSVINWPESGRPLRVAQQQDRSKCYPFPLRDYSKNGLDWPTIVTYVSRQHMPSHGYPDSLD